MTERVQTTTPTATPTASSTFYSGAITVAETGTLKAIAVATGFSNSAVASAAYIINFPPDFSVSAAPATLTVTAGSSGTGMISISPQESFASAVSFACSGLPAGDACSFSPATVTPSGPAAATTTLTVTTSATSASLHGNRQSLFPEAALVGMFEDAFLATAWHVAHDLLENGWAPNDAPAGPRDRGRLRVVRGSDAA